MKHEHARQILLLYRPGVDDADPEVAAALALAQRDEGLRHWFEAQQGAQAAIGKQFKGISPPAAFREQIVSERPWHTRPVTARHLLALASAVVVISLIGFWWSHQPPAEDKSFPAYRSRMVSTAQRGYGMDLEAGDLASIRSFIKQRGAPDDFTSPAGLTRATPLGCLIQNWQTGKVAMICFKTGRVLPPGQASDLWLFVIDHPKVPDAPNVASPQFKTLNAVATASWTYNGKTYVLAVEGDEDYLRKYL